MSVIEAIILGLIQGLTEFIPVSSSGHLLLLHHAFGFTRQGLGFDVALHIGTLLSLMVFFHRDITELVRSVFQRGPKTGLAWLLMAATVPAVIAGILLQDKAESSFRSPLLVSFNLAIAALVMLWAERYATQTKQLTSVEAVSARQGLTIGLAQAIALIPGVSRSGSTIIAGLFSGLDRVTATRFSFLLSIPITFGAILKIAADADTIAQAKDEPSLFLVGIVTAFISGVFAIRFLLKFVAKHSLKLFAYYRLILAGVTILLLVLF